MNIKIIKQSAYINLSLVISVMAPMVINIVSPAIPFLMAYFFNSNLVNYVIPVAVVGLLAGQIIAGLISINISKNTIIRAGLYAFILSSLLCFLASNIIIFLIGRFLQGVCASIIGVNNRALVREKFDDKTYGIVIGYVMLCWNIFVMIMPLVGGVTQI
ncbi:MAG: MFS transporter, partial [Rickettsiaceae bacterium]|nr:MFS transporter [Rickettsiaceae bacterium]